MFEPISKAVTDTKEELVKESKPTTKTIEALSQTTKFSLGTSLQLKNEQLLFSADKVDDLVDLMTILKEIHCSFLQNTK